MSIINQNGESMPLQWFLSPTNTDFPQQMAAICEEITQRNISAVKVLNPTGFAALQRIVNGVKELFEDDETAEIEVCYKDLNMCCDIIVKTTYLWITRLGEVQTLQGILNDTPSIMFEPVDNNYIKIYFGSPPIYGILGGQNE